MTALFEKVAPIIIADHAEYYGRWRSALKYSLYSVLEKVINRRQSVVSCLDGVPSYLWCEIILDDGTLYPNIDLGNLPSVTRADGRGLRCSWPRMDQFLIVTHKMTVHPFLPRPSKTELTWLTIA